MIDTSTVTDRRSLRFNTIDDLLADLAKIEAAAKRGPIRHSGNWTPGQILGHLATWLNYGFDGTPLNPPWILKAILRLMKKRFLRGPMKVGVKIPKVEGGTLGTENMPIEEGLRRYRQALARLRTAAPSRPNVILGPLTHDEWIQLTLRHAELHLSFLQL